MQIHSLFQGEPKTAQLVSRRFPNHQEPWAFFETKGPIQSLKGEVPKTNLSQRKLTENML